MGLVDRIIKQAQSDPRRIVFPESDEPRTIKAVEELVKKKIARPILIGERKNLGALYSSEVMKIAVVVEPDAKCLKRFLPRLMALRKDKGMTEGLAREELKDRMVLAVMMMDAGDADGAVSGAVHPTSHTIRPAFQIIGAKTKGRKASGVFIMEDPKNAKTKRFFLFADCAVNPDPTAEELAGIAVDTANTALSFGIKPVVALLSFSTYGSASHQLIEKVQKAAVLAKSQAPKGSIIDGELQLDAAIIPEVCKNKAPESPVKGKANVLIFPDLNAGNIGYKLAERLGGLQAVGPFIQGLKMPVNDLSRGCSVKDIVDVAAITVVQAQGCRRTQRCRK